MQNEGAVEQLCAMLNINYVLWNINDTNIIANWHILVKSLKCNLLWI